MPCRPLRGGERDCGGVKERSKRFLSGRGFDHLIAQHTTPQADGAQKGIFTAYLSQQLQAGPCEGTAYAQRIQELTFAQCPKVRSD